MAFIEAEFPRAISLNAVGGPGYSTNLNSGFSGYEQRNQNWTLPLGAWQIAFNSKPQAWYDAVQAFFHAVRGRANGFRLFWHADYQGLGQFIGNGDGTTTEFQLQKTYSFPITEYTLVKPIQKPIMASVIDYQGNSLTNTVVMYITRNGVKTTKTLGTDYTVDATTGIVTFTTAPNSAAQNIALGQGTLADIVTADFQFHWPARLDLDQLQPKLTTPKQAGLLFTLDNLTLKELRIKLGQSSG